MNAVHWHLILNHIPIMATLFGLLTLVYGWWRKDTEVNRVALALLIVGGLSVIPVYSTGHSAEKIAKDLSGVSEQSIEHHEELANTSYYLLLLLGIVSLGGFFRTFQVERLSGVLMVTIGIIGLIALVSVVRTATAGGKIRHPEIAVQTPSGGTDDTNETHTHDHEH